MSYYKEMLIEIDDNIMNTFIIKTYKKIYLYSHIYISYYTIIK